MTGEATFDLIVVGSGAGAVCAALLAQSRGLRPLIVEKTDKFGGSTALSGGIAWIPANPVMTRAGVTDSEQQASQYLDACAGPPGKGSSRARRAAFLREGPRAVEFLEQCGMQFVHCEGYSDYHEGEYPGGLARGRAFEAKMFDLRELGSWAGRLRRHEGAFGVPISVAEMAQVALDGRTLKSRAAFMKVGWRMMRNRLGKQLVRMGAAFQGRLLAIALQRNVEIWTSAAVTGLLTHDGAVVGVKVSKDGREQPLCARRGVLIDAGGFSHNTAMRAAHLRAGADTAWTVANPGDTGEMQLMAMQLGAATAMMDEAWWIPSSRLPNGTFVFNNPLEMAKPHCIMVDGSGERYVNEATSYVALGINMYERHKSVPAVPSWLILDSRHRSKYRWGGVRRGVPPAEWIASGYMKKSDTVAGLAAQCGLDSVRLRATVERFNRFARAGVDEDFARGVSAHHRFWGDPTQSPNPSLGTIEKPPFYAVAVHVGEVGTAGGLVTDEHARVLKQDGSPIAGLYATGNSTASVLGRSYPGPGASIGASLVFGYIAAEHLVRQSSDLYAAPLDTLCL